MSRALTIGNGNLLIGIDYRGQVRDFYFPYVGHANHVSGASGSYTHRVGVWVDGVLRWFSHDSWKISIQTDGAGSECTLIAENGELGVRVTIVDCVHNEKNIFLRKITVANEHDEPRTIKVFFGQEFRISESRRGDTGFYDPRVASIMHYKGHQAFLVHALFNGKSFTDYSVGLFGIENKEGTYADAEDGVLSKNPIEHGSVDSVIGLSHDFKGKTTVPLDYWITAGRTIQEAHALHRHVLEETPERLVTSTKHYWHAWIKKESQDLSLLEKPLQHLYHRSLLIIRTHADNRGGIIASSDSDMLNQGRDTYSYVWPRDAAVSAHALDQAGYFDTSSRFFNFVAKLVEPDGYLMHKYRVDGVLGSSWHPWVRNGVFELPIQEDETATTIFLLASHYERAKDIEFIEALYNPFIESAADFMCGFIDHETGLPASSYDLWEEKFGISTYTAASVYGALGAAAHLSALLGKRDNAAKYRRRAESIKKAMLTYLYDVNTKTFIKLVRYDGKKLVRDATIDMSSLHGIINFGVLPVFDSHVTEMVKVVEEKLKVPTAHGGYMRYEGDGYYKVGPDAPPNAWCITTLWMAQYYIKVARTVTDLRKAYDILLWIHDRAQGSGILPEQIHPFTGADLSTSPLVWSHAEFILTADMYIRKYRSLK
jgi:oligosaccharide amylase